MRVIKVGNAQGFWGDQPNAPLHLIKQQPDIDYLTLDYLSEVSMSILAIQRERNPTMGYAEDFVELMAAFAPLWKSGLKTKIICNAGGLNPKGCARACQEILKKLDCAHIRIGIVSGDDVLPLLQKSPDSSQFHNLETGKSLQYVAKHLATANAYLGAKPLVDALAQNAQIIISGRVADPSLTVAACVHTFGWNWTDYHRLAGATVAGHLIECGTQVTGGISNRWLELPDLAHIGFPIAEINEEGQCVITKPPRTGGAVSLETVKEQLLYEIGDPSRYLSPDVTVSFMNVKVEQLSVNRVQVTDAVGSAPPSNYKVSATFKDGFRSEAMLTVVGRDAKKKALKAGEIILERVRVAGFELDHTRIECLGAGDSIPDILSHEDNHLEIVLRVAVADRRREAVEAFSKEVAPMVTSGPAGITGYATGRPKIRPVFGYWPCLIDAAEVTPIIEIVEAS